MRRRPQTALLLLLALLVGGGVWWVLGDHSEDAPVVGAPAVDAAASSEAEVTPMRAGPRLAASGARLTGSEAQAPQPETAPTLHRLSVRLLVGGVPLPQARIALRRRHTQPFTTPQDFGLSPPHQTAETDADAWAHFAVPDGTYLVSPQPKTRYMVLPIVDALESAPRRGWEPSTTAAGLWPMQPVTVQEQDPSPVILDLPACSLTLNAAIKGGRGSTEGIEVTLHRAEKGGANVGVLGVVGTLDKQGTCRFELLPPGVYHLQTQSDWHRDVRDLAIDLSAGHAVRTFDIQPTGNVAIRLTSDRGRLVGISPGLDFHLRPTKQREAMRTRARTIDPPLVVQGLIPGRYELLLPDHLPVDSQRGSTPSGRPVRDALNFQPAVLLRPVYFDVRAGKVTEIDVRVAYRARLEIRVHGPEALRERAQIVVRTLGEDSRRVSSTFSWSHSVAFDGYMPRGSYRVSLSGRGIKPQEREILVDENTQTLIFTVP